MIVNNEDELLDEAVRKQIIEDIEGPENKARKDFAYKKYQIAKDKTKDYVRAHLMRLLSPVTVSEMEYALANISIVKKIVDKLARVYSNGVDRVMPNDEETEKLTRLEQKLQANTALKTSNKILKLQRNAALYIKPVSCAVTYGDEIAEKWAPSWLPLSPHLYDVVEFPNNRTKALAYILSNYEMPSNISGNAQSVPERAATHSISSVLPFRGDGKDQSIADKKEDEGAGKGKVYIWWTEKYHFTTLGNQIVDPKTLLPFQLEAGESILDKVANPIETKPFVDLHIDQEGSYWAEGGDDLIDGAILINSLISNAHHIAVTQGYGQLVISGAKIPGKIELGPNKMIGLPHESNDEPTPTAQFITASPPLADLQNQIEMYVALLLTTNNLSTSGISVNLQGGISAPSGIALALDKAESLEDVQDQRNLFYDAEMPAWKITARWLQYFNEQQILDDSFSEMIIPEVEPVVNFKDMQIIQSESEKLDNIKKRQEMKLNTQLELIMKDRDVSLEEAKEILKQILEESLAKMAMFGAPPPAPAAAEDEQSVDDENEDMNEDQQDIGK